ncbi:hypothetical protein CAPTEDRAFT_227541 [Capitella teleta]|uniref:G-protein coupled receptors family 3 profile domain-containing protein n=1 Tax=Capitella teleta TaxID=283909 RepID=R7TES5_CAPTE|nr:hypothetical protein CAPTEDRAFT_227541 [Capitella teleta]|eukprot:ELT89977.1 hypothetical protein CAPTEDRAFT_227541 [Capitella teleta]
MEASQMEVTDPDAEEMAKGRLTASFAIMCSLAVLGILYSLAIMIFNALKHKDNASMGADEIICLSITTIRHNAMCHAVVNTGVICHEIGGPRIIKMTSPNINIVILIGACSAYSSIVLIGLDSSLVSFSNMASLVQASSFLLCFSFSLIYGSIFSKVWRVFMIFKNINFNGKNTRDEHLLLVVFVLLLVDLAVLVPWTSTDSIQCYPTVYINNSTLSSSSTIRVDTCHSSLQSLWIALIYIIKGGLLLVGLFFTWQTRRVTLPSLKDTWQIFVVVFTALCMAVLCLPILLHEDVNMSTRFITGSLAIWIVTTTTVTLLFIPKILLWHREKVRDSPDSFRFQFTESMKKTQEAVKNCSLCFGCGTETEEEKYATEVLTNEIETLKKNIKEKDATIRELTDRLFLGAEKFQQYLTSPKRPNQTFARKTIACRTTSQPYGDNNHVIGEDGKKLQRRQLQRAMTADQHSDVFQRDNVRGFENGALVASPQHTSQSYAVSVVDAGPAYYPVSQEYPRNHDTKPRLSVPGHQQMMNISHGTHSPSHDSAIENMTPCTSDSSERGSYSDAHKVTSSQGFRPPLLRAMTEPSSMNVAYAPTVSLSHINMQEIEEAPVHYRSVAAVRRPMHQRQNGHEAVLYRGSSIEQATVSQI